ncbi:MAG TPA: PIN domain-containing protein [Solirubrobacteraceae bacterium]|jgi:predicted nucleic acid-binding protein|nr:PIN domain-containing protein [Solirubrobacteraceae bacterium]
MSLFVDTSAFYALVDQDDRHHARASELLRGQDTLLTTDHVLVESWRLMRDCGGYASAERFWAGIRGGVANVEVVLPGDMDAAWRIGELFSDQDFSIVDRTSFAVMERLGIDRVATFDNDFSIYRYGPRREYAFDVRR